MSPFYFIATVVNATSCQVRISTTAENRARAFSAVAFKLAEQGFDTTQLQNVSASQYRAASVSVRRTIEVSIKAEPTTISPAFPV